VWLWVRRGGGDLVCERVHDGAVFFVFFGSGWEVHIVHEKRMPFFDGIARFFFVFFILFSPRNRLTTPKKIHLTDI
jgi:hypothetical protein